MTTVAPPRAERGLKYSAIGLFDTYIGRSASRGAWIEIF